MREEWLMKKIKVIEIEGLGDREAGIKRGVGKR